MIQFRNEHVTVFQSALFQTTSTVIETKELILVVDPTWLPHEVEDIQHYVQKVRGEREVYLFFTHGDFDHVIGYEAFPGATIIGSKGLQEHPNKAKKVELIKQFDCEHYINRPYRVSFPEVDVVIAEDGQQVVKGETVITFYLAPGHTHDGLFAVVEPMGIWIAGDYLSDFELPFIYQSAKAYEQTLAKAETILHTFSISALIPGHGKTTANEQEMKRRIEVSKDYLKRLKEAVLRDDQETMAELERDMAFPSSFTKECHDLNIEIMRKEYM